MSEAFQPGARFGEYTIIREMGRGTFGLVYEVKKGDLQKRRALKVLLRRWSDDPQIVARFKKEALSANAFEHPNVIEVETIGHVDDVHFIEMEYLVGESLKDRLRKMKRLPLHFTLDLMLPIIDAVDTINKKGVVHRDIKPENVFLSINRNGVITPKILDFGIARLNLPLDRDEDTLPNGPEEQTGSQQQIGTPSYMSPEQIQTPTLIDGRSDQWALCVLLYEVLTGRGPFRVRDNPTQTLIQIVTIDPPPMNEEGVGHPDGLEAVIGKGLAKKRDERFATTRDLGIALLPFASQKARETYEKEWSIQAETPAGRAKTIEVLAPAFVLPFVPPPAPVAEPSQRDDSVTPPPVGEIAVGVRSSKRSARYVGAAAIAFALLLGVSSVHYGGQWLHQRDAARAATQTHVIAHTPEPEPEPPSTPTSITEPGIVVPEPTPPAVQLPPDAAVAALLVQIQAPAPGERQHRHSGRTARPRHSIEGNQNPTVAAPRSPTAPAVENSSTPHSAPRPSLMGGFARTIR
jgi:eukaryotic-like serine/threonine-protein kinase